MISHTFHFLCQCLYHDECYFLCAIYCHLSFHIFPVQFHWGFSSPFKLNTGLKTFLSLPTAQKFKNPCPFSPSHYTTDIFTAVVAAGHTFDFPLHPSTVHLLMWSTTADILFQILALVSVFYLPTLQSMLRVAKAKAKAGIKISVGQNHTKHKAYAYYCPLVHAHNLVL